MNVDGLALAKINEVYHKNGEVTVFEAYYNCEKYQPYVRLKVISKTLGVSETVIMPSKQFEKEDRGPVAIRVRSLEFALNDLVMEALNR